MSVVYPSDYPRTLHEAITEAMTVNDEDIDYSDIPEVTDEEAKLFEPAGDRFIEMGRRNLIFINRLLHEYYANRTARV